MIPLAVVDDCGFETHVAQDPHPERPERLAAARAGLHAAVPSAQRLKIPARPALNEELIAVHPMSHLQALRSALARGTGSLDPDTYFNAHTGHAAWLAAGACVDLAAALVSGAAQRGFALVRPPGHHAEPTRSMGFCWLNNVAVAAHAALRAGLQRVAIVDWDVHHGNGTQAAFEDDPRVLFISLHQAPLYPGTGHATEIGTGAGRGYTVNLPLPARSALPTYAAAFRRVILPLLTSFHPELVLVSAGFDAHVRDPLASMALDATGYAALTSALVSATEQAGHGRLGLVLEGGYDLTALETSVAATCHALLGAKTSLPTTAATPEGEQAISRTVEALHPYWPTLDGA